MKIYNYSPATKEYLSEGVADSNPKVKDGVLIPAYATTIEPLALTGSNQKQVFDEATKTWSIVPDYRGSMFYKTVDGSEIVIYELGKSPDTTMTLTPRPSVYHEWAGVSWTLDVVKLKTLIVRKLKAKTTAYIMKDDAEAVYMPMWRQTSWAEFVRLYEKKQSTILSTEEQAYMDSMLDAGETELSFYNVCKQMQQWIAQVRNAHNILEQSIIADTATDPAYYESLVDGVVYPVWIGY